MRKVHESGPQRDGEHAGGLGAAADEVTCVQFVELITDYFEGALLPRTLSRVEEHLVMCDWCRAYTGQMQVTVDSVGELNDQVTRRPPGPLLAALRSKEAAGQ
jgi:predicted anti-sigma-YlaC factor YlaD